MAPYKEGLRTQNLNLVETLPSQVRKITLAVSDHEQIRLVLSKKPDFLSLLLELDELQDAVLHLLDSLVLCEAHAALVGNVVHASDSLGVLSGCHGPGDGICWRPPRDGRSWRPAWGP